MDKQCKQVRSHISWLSVCDVLMCGTVLMKLLAAVNCWTAGHVRVLTEYDTNYKQVLDTKPTIPDCHPQV
jgi:hypothetical protein